MLYIDLIGNTDQSFHYYKILSRAAGQRRLAKFQKYFFVKNFGILELLGGRKTAHNIVYLKQIFLFPIGNYLPLRLITTIVRIFDNRIQVKPQHICLNQLHAFRINYKYYLNICILQQGLKETIMTSQSPYVTEIKQLSVSLDRICCSETKQYVWSGNSDMVQFSKDQELYFGKFCFNL